MSCTKNFMMEIPIALHDIVQDFIISALTIRPASYVDYAVEYYLHLQAKESRETYRSFRVRSEVDTPGADSEVCIDGEPVSDTVNIFQVSINPDAFQSPDPKHYPFEDEPTDSDSIVDLPTSDQAVPTQQHIQVSDANVTMLRRSSLSSLKSENNLLQTSSPIHSPSQSLSLNRNSFTVASSNSLAVPISNAINFSPITSSSTINGLSSLHLHSAVPIPAKLINQSVSPQLATIHSKHEVTSHHDSPFTTPPKGRHQNGHSHLPQSNNFQCKSCRGVFKPHVLPINQTFLNLSETPDVTRPLHPSTQDTPERTVYSLLQPSHFPHNGTPQSTFYRTPNNSTDNSEKKFHCPICEKSYKSNTGLKRHLIVHTGERPYQCQYCFKSFYRKYVLTTHISRVHAKQIAAM